MCLQQTCCKKQQRKGDAAAAAAGVVCVEGWMGERMCVVGGVGRCVWVGCSPPSIHKLGSSSVMM